MPDPVVHHIELCVFNADDTLNRLKKFGFNLFAKKTTARCKQLVARLNTVIFVITEKNHNINWRQTENFENETIRTEPMTLVCCENSRHEVDTVFNLAFNVTKSDVKNICERICVCDGGGKIIQAPTEISDDKGTVSYSIVKSNCGNVLHTLINTDDYNGQFLPGFEIVDDKVNFHDPYIFGIDHVTLACHTGHTSRITSFYEKCFLMKRFEITRNDDETNGLIISDGVGLRLRAMSYWRCSETGLSYNGNNFLLVIVESLEGQTNCNVHEFLTQHQKDGIEHIAFRSKDIIQSVSKLRNVGVIFRNPPRAYYDELRSLGKISGLGVDLNRLSELGILLDNEDDSADESEESLEKKKKYLMQIFAKPLFNLKTFFIELIERSGARGLGSGNILALVRSIREEERRNKLKSEAKTQEIPKESFTSPRHC